MPLPVKWKNSDARTVLPVFAALDRFSDLAYTEPKEFRKEVPALEIRTLRYFLAVAREENMTRAAQLLHVTQPTLSKQLRALEEELGKKLFLRHSFSIELTDEGVLLRKRAEDLVRTG